jgi:hypothetical protein
MRFISSFSFLDYRTKPPEVAVSGPLGLAAFAAQTRGFLIFLGST